MKRYTLLILLSLTALTMTAQTQKEQWFEQANAAYNVGNYDSAMMLYEQILATDMESVPLYYNMGNAYYKMREYPMGKVMNSLRLALTGAASGLGIAAILSFIGRDEFARRMHYIAERLG